MANIITAGNSTNGGTAISTDTSGTLNIVTGSGSGANSITIDASQNVTFANAITTTGNGTIGGALSVTGNATITGTLTATGGVANSIKAWVNFNGTGTVAIRGSFNVTSITDNGTGDYTINFTTAMPDINYCPAFYLAVYFDSRASVNNRTLGNSTRTTSGFRFQTTWTSATTGGASVEDLPDINIAIFR
jgi:hypothetical protein